MCITFREANNILLENGFILDKVKGSHYQYLRNGRRVVINLKLNKMVWKRVCKENKIIY